MKHNSLARQLTAQFFWGNVPMFALAVFAALTGGQLQSAEKRVSDQNRDFTAALSDCLGGFSVVKTFRAEKEIFRLFAESNRRAGRADGASGHGRYPVPVRRHTHCRHAHAGAGGAAPL